MSLSARNRGLARSFGRNSSTAMLVGTVHVGLKTIAPTSDRTTGVGWSSSPTTTREARRTLPVLDDGHRGVRRVHHEVPRLELPGKPAPALQVHRDLADAADRARRACRPGQRPREARGAPSRGGRTPRGAAAAPRATRRACRPRPPPRARGSGPPGRAAGCPSPAGPPRGEAGRPARPPRSGAGQSVRRSSRWTAIASDAGSARRRSAAQPVVRRQEAVVPRPGQGVERERGAGDAARIRSPDGLEADRAVELSQDPGAERLSVDPEEGPDSSAARRSLAAGPLSARATAASRARLETATAVAART